MKELGIRDSGQRAWSQTALWKNQLTPNPLSKKDNWTSKILLKRPETSLCFSVSAHGVHAYTRTIAYLDNNRTRAQFCDGSFTVLMFAKF